MGAVSLLGQAEVICVWGGGGARRRIEGGRGGGQIGERRRRRLLGGGGVKKKSFQYFLKFFFFCFVFVPCRAPLHADSDGGGAAAAARGVSQEPHPARRSGCGWKHAGRGRDDGGWRETRSDTFSLSLRPKVDRLYTSLEMALFFFGTQIIVVHLLGQFLRIISPNFCF